MKLQILILLSFSSLNVFAQDCFFCLPDYSWTQPQVPEWPIEYTQIEEVSYDRNPRATYCKRPEDMVDTIVLHHSETPSTTTPQGINDFHLQRGTASDPWYMIAYSYVINSPYPGATLPRARVTEGRPLDIVGAHAGSNVFVPMDADQKKMFDDGKITCGNDRIGFKKDDTLIKDGKIKANVTTIGLVVIGNYSPFSKKNPNGYPVKRPRYPTKDTQDMIARTSCQLQKKHPRMKYIKWHNYYHATSCPGTIRQYVSQIKTLARKYGCEFF